MSNCIFGTPIYSDVNQTYTPTFSGGSWSGSLPLTNLQDRRLAKVARSTNATTANTQFDADLKLARAIRVFAIPKHNFSISATVRLRGSSSSSNFNVGSNYFLWSEALDNAAWTKANSTITADAANDSDGAATLDKIKEDNSNAAHYVQQSTPTLTNSAAQQLAIEFRAAERTWCWVGTLNKTGVPSVSYINLSTGALGTVSGNHSITVLSLGGGLYRVIISWNAATGASAPFVNFGPATGDLGQSYVGTTGNGIYAGHIQGLEGAAIGNYQKTTSATVTGGFLVYDSGTVEVFPASTLITAESLAELRARGINPGFTHVLSSAQSAQYWRIEITDTGNAAGYVELGRLILAGGWQPTINLAYGAKIGGLTSTTAQETDGGATIFNVKSGKRTLVGSIEMLPQDEAFESGYDMIRSLGIDKQLHFVFDAADVKHLWRRSFLAVFKEPSAIEFPYFATNAIPFALVEEL